MRSEITDSDGDTHEGEVVHRDEGPGLLDFVASAFNPVGSALCGGMDSPDVTIRDDDGDIHVGKEN